MDVVTLEPGKAAPDDKDRVHINEMPTGRFGFSGSVVIYPDPPSKPFAIHNTAENIFPSVEAARGAAVAWAQSRGATVLYVETEHA